VAIIRIPKIGMDKAVVQGVSLSDLRKGPGHYPSTPLPGEGGNAAIAGHRTTYGAPFNRLDELAPGDDIEVTTLRGTFKYKVSEQKVVKPSQVEVLDPTPEPRLTLTTCHPKYSASSRLVIIAAPAPGEPAPPPPPPVTAKPPDEVKQDEPPSLADAGLASGHSKMVTVLWAALTALVGFAWWWSTRRRRHWTTYAAGVLPFLVVLFVFYAHLERLLPANF
jgi:sortase A